MKTGLAIFALGMAAAAAVSTAQAQQLGFASVGGNSFQEVAVASYTAADSQVLSSASGACCGAPCGSGCGDCCGCNPCCCVSPWAHRSGLWGEYLLLRPRDQEIAFAVPGQAPVVVGGVPTIPVPQGKTLVLDPDYQPGYRVGAVLALDDCTSVGLTYTSFESQTHNGQALTNDQIQQNINLFPLLLHPRTALPNNVTNVAAQGELDVDFDILDLDGRSLLFNTDSFAVNAIGGVRWANMNQDVITAYTINGGTVVRGSSQYDGLGARGGLDLEYRSTSGFGAYGRGVFSLLYGAGRGDYEQFQINNRANPQVFTDAKYDRLSPMLDFEMGVQWLSPQQRLRLSMGYMTMVWFNVVTARDYMNGVIDSQFDDFSDTITFDGLTARVEVKF